ncbi:MAG: RNA methyltransferase [Marinilabiliaceae bacterium]|nr:RNA methyltransferase [Marinilabiliaceae bacterium]
MLSKNQEKLIVSLSKKKYRDKLKLFVAEGPKLILDLVNSGLKPFIIVCDKHFHYKKNSLGDVDPVITTESVIKKLSNLKTPQNVIAVFHQQNNFSEKIDINSLILGLDGIQDPGNFGTILRIADWFGIKTIICSTDTVDIYNPKVVQSSMGAIARLNVRYENLEEFCIKYTESQNIIYGAFTNGDNIYNTQLSPKGLIIMGNEGNGIRPEIEKLITQKLSIPTFSTNKTLPESLNVSVATAVICSEFKRTIGKRS